MVQAENSATARYAYYTRFFSEMQIDAATRL
jgi:hypothetical protein